MSKAIADLLHEHETISSAMHLLDRMTAALEKASTVDTRDLLDFIGFLKEFVDQCHHSKEEIYLFPAMVAAGIRDQGGPVGVLLSEHARGRQLIRDMQDSISPAFDRAKFTQASRDLSSLYRNHIHKENMVMFPMAERAVTVLQLEMMFVGFKDMEETALGQGRLEEVLEVMKRLQGKYPPGK
jgi:hemerythrin-like domain-containing protein